MALPITVAEVARELRDASANLRAIAPRLPVVIEVEGREELGRAIGVELTVRGLIVTVSEADLPMRCGGCE